MIENASKIETENLAQKTLEKLKDINGRLSFPIDPFQLLQLYNVIVTFSDFDKLEGLLLYSNTEPSIVSINLNRQIQRQRFTAAHELGHILMHSDNKGENFLCPVRGQKSKIEKEADEFANCLLMPSGEMFKQIEKYKNNNGDIDLEEALYIAEYFGVSFAACVKTIRFKYNKFSIREDNEELNKLLKKFKPKEKRIELFGNTNDLKLLQKAIDYRYFSIINTSEITGLRFIQNFVYHESRLEKINIEPEQVNEIFADFRINGSNSRFCTEKNRNIIEALGNIEMTKYCLETEDELTIFKMKELHKLLYKYSPFPEYAGSFKVNNNIISGGTTQPTNVVFLFKNLEKIEQLIRIVVDNFVKYNVSDYIKEICVIHHAITKLHPFDDGNGRVSRGILNWLLRIKKLPPIYIDSSYKKEYLNALSDMDIKNNSEKLELIVLKAIMKTMVEINEQWI